MQAAVGVVLRGSRRSARLSHSRTFGERCGGRICRRRARLRRAEDGPAQPSSLPSSSVDAALAHRQRSASARSRRRTARARATDGKCSQTAALPPSARLRPRAAAHRWQPPSPARLRQRRPIRGEPRSACSREDRRSRFSRCGPLRAGRSGGVTPLGIAATWPAHSVVACTASLVRIRTAVERRARRRRRRRARFDFRREPSGVAVVSGLRTATAKRGAIVAAQPR